MTHTTKRFLKVLSGVFLCLLFISTTMDAVAADAGSIISGAGKLGRGGDGGGPRFVK